MKSLCLVLAAACLLMACSGKKDQKTVAVTEEQLPSMVLALSDFGPDFAGMELDESSGPYSNEEQIADADDPDDEQSDIAKFGRETGYVKSWSDFAAALEDPGKPFILVTGVELFSTVRGARDAVQDEVSDNARDFAATDDLGKLIAFNPFKPGIGDSSAGASARFRIAAEDLETDHDVDLSLQMITFQRDRVTATLYVIRTGTSDGRNEAKKFAQAMNKRMDAVFNGADPDGGQNAVAGGKPPLSPNDSVEARALLQEVQANMSAFDTLTVKQSEQVRIPGQGPVFSTNTMTYRISTSEAYVSMEPNLEMYMVGLDAYLKPAGQAWQCYQDITGFTLKDLGFSADSFKATLDLDDFARGVTELSPTKFQGEDVRHLKVTMDLEDYLAGVAGAIGAGGGLQDVFDSIKGDEVTLDVYVSTAAKQIRQVVANFDMTIDGEKVSVVAEGVYSDLGAPFQAPLKAPYPVCKN